MNAHFPCVHFCFSQYRAMTNTQQHPYSFQKKERLCSKRIIDTLFDGGSKSFSAYPLRAVFRSIPTETDQELVSVLVSVSKKHFKRAVKRNRAKRQIREAYRKNKSLIYEVLESNANAPKHIAIAFLWQTDELMLTSVVESKMRSLLHRIAEYIHKEYGNPETVVEPAE